MANYLNFAGSSIDFITSWRENALGVWAAATALLIIVAWQLLLVLSRHRGQRSADSREVVKESCTVLNPSSNSWISRIITDANLVEFMKELDPKNEENELWEDVIDKKSDTFSYNAKCCRPKHVEYGAVHSYIEYAADAVELLLILQEMMLICSCFLDSPHIHCCLLH